MSKVTRSSATDQEQANYLAAGMDTQNALATAVRLLKGRQVLSDDPDESRWIAVTVASLEAEIARIQAELLTFLAERSAIEPPSPGMVQEIQSIVRGLDTMTAGQALTSAIIDATTAALTRWNTTR